MKLYCKCVDADKQAKLKKEYDDYVSGNSIYNFLWSFKHVCHYCGDIFYSRNRREKYCSQRCINDEYIKKRKLRKQEERHKICQICGKSYDAKKRDSKYCSPACKQKAYRLKYVTNLSFIQMEESYK